MAKKILVLYHSQEKGNTHAMAEAVAKGASGLGAKVKLINTNEERADVEEFRKADAVAIGTPDYYSYMAGGVKMFLDDWYMARKDNPNRLTGKLYGLFYSHGGGNGVRGKLENLCRRFGSQVGVIVESVGSPGSSELTACNSLGEQLAITEQ